jgi:predicted enzyme related to lactoylglutathione lyase
MKFLGISWAGIPVQDFEAAIEFFRDRLGIPMSRVNHEIQAAHFPLANGDLIEVFGPNNADETHRRNVVIALSVENLDQARTELEKAGVENLTETGTWEDEAWFYFEGPDGLLFEVKSKG